MEYLQYWQAVKRRWPVMLASILIICGGVVLHHLVLKSQGKIHKQHKATATILVSQSSLISAEDIANIGASYGILAPIFREVYGDEIATQWSDAGVYRDEFLRFRSGVRFEAVRSGPEKGNIVTVSVTGDREERAITAANRLAAAVQQSALGASMQSFTKQKGFTSEEVEARKRELDEKLAALQRFKESHQGRILPMDFAQAQAQVNMLERDARDSQSSVEEYARRVQALRSTIARRSNDPKFDANTAPSSAVIDRLQGQMAAQEVELMNLRLKYTDEHPKVIETRQIIQNIKDRINAEVSKAYNLADAPASLEYQFVVGDISRYEAERMAADARRRAISGMLQRARSELASVPALELNLAKLNNEAAEAQKKYESVAERQFQSEYSMSITKRQLDLGDKGEPPLGTVYEAGYAPETPASRLQSLRYKLPIALIIALIVGLGLCLLLDASDTSIRDVDQVEDRYQLPVLGVVPMLREAGVKGGSTLVLRDSAETPYAESYRIMRANFVALAHQSGAHSVVITSTLPGEGKSTTAANFASSLAESHKRVVLIDADMRNPSLHRAFEVDKEPGLSNYLAGTASVEDIIFPTSIENLVLISAGTIPDNPARLLTGPRMRELLDRLRQEADYVVIDTPPAVAFSDATELGAIVDSMIVVVGAGSKLESAHFRARTQLANVQAVVVGTVLNRVQPDHVDSYRYSARYYPKLNGSGKLPKKGAEQAALPDGKA